MKLKKCMMSFKRVKTLKKIVTPVKVQKLTQYDNINNIK